MTRRRRPLPILLEAGVVLVMASLAIRLVPLRRLAATLGRSQSPKRAFVTDTTAINGAIKAWSRRLPWRTMCFEEGLTAHWMLRRRGLASTLHYGAATIDGELKAHVWVRSGEIDVTGCESADNYAMLARFPPT